MNGKKTRARFNVTELRSLNLYLQIAFSHYADIDCGKNTCKEILRLKEKIEQMILQQRKVR